MASMLNKVIMCLTTLTVMTMICETPNAETYMLGWTDGTPTELHYTTWGSGHSFHVGDVIVFFFDPGYDTVLQVTRENFEACNTINPTATWSDDIGQGAFEMLEPGHFYFISGIPGHCEHGQKIDVLVPEVNGHGPLQTPSVMTPSPSNDGQNIPYVPASSPSSSTTSIWSSYSNFQRLGALVLVSFLFSVPV